MALRGSQYQFTNKKYAKCESARSPNCVQTTKDEIYKNALKANLRVSIVQSCVGLDSPSQKTIVLMLKLLL